MPRYTERVDSNNNPILIIIPNDTTKCKTLEFEIGETPESTSYSCESACRDYLDLNIISALQVFITDNWEQDKTNQKKRNLMTEEQDKDKRREKTSYRPRYTDEKQILAESILIDGEPYWLISETVDDNQ